MSDEDVDREDNSVRNAKASEPEPEDRHASVQMEQELAEQTEKFWEAKSKEERRHYYSQIDLNYHTIVDEFFTLADLSAGRFMAFTSLHMTWRRVMTILAGVLAILNILVAYTGARPDTANAMMQYLPLAAAVFAAVIAVLSNFENLNQYLGRAQGHREVREEALNTARKYEMLWHVYVRPFGDAPAACVNASKIYQRIIEADQGIRRQTKDLTKISRTTSIPKSGTQ